MNKVILMGRLTKDPDIRYTQGQESICVARFNLAVDRRYKKDGSQQSADFPSCIAFRNTAEFLHKYCTKGTKLVIEGHLQTGSYDNKNGQKVYTTDVIVDSCEFAESKKTQENAPAQTAPAPQADNDGFINVEDGIDGDLPFI